jgi:protein ImuA
VEKRLQRTICLEELRRRIAGLETAARRPAGGPPVSTGCASLDRLLPERGFRRGALVEWLSPGDGTGAGTLALLTAREASRHEGVVVVLDRHREFCPTAAVRLGIAPQQFIVVHAQSAADNDWAMDQALRSPAVAAVLAWPERLDDRTFRRWQLAAEEGGCLGLLLRPETARDEPSWADVRLWVEPLPMVGQVANLSHVAANLSHVAANLSHVAANLSYVAANLSHYDRRRLRILLLRCRGGTAGRGVDVEFDDETHRVYPLEKQRLQIAN